MTRDCPTMGERESLRQQSIVRTIIGVIKKTRTGSLAGTRSLSVALIDINDDAAINSEWLSHMH